MPPSETSSAQDIDQSPAPVAAIDAVPGARPRLLRTLRDRWSILVLLLLVTTFSALKPDQFATRFNVTNIAVDASSYLILAVGVTFVITIGGIDLSAGSVLIGSGVAPPRANIPGGGASLTTALVGLAAG